MVAAALDVAADVADVAAVVNISHTEPLAPTHDSWSLVRGLCGVPLFPL